MTTYYPIKAAARLAQVTTRTIYRWMSLGYRTERGLLKLRAEYVKGRQCIEEKHLKAFVEQRRVHIEFTKAINDKFSIP